MAFLYKGKVENLAKEVAKAQDLINQRYREILGDERFQRLDEVSNRVLTPDSFLNSIEELNEYAEENIPRDTSSKFIFPIYGKHELFSSGRIKDTKVKAGMGFYLSEDSIKNSDSYEITGNIITPLIHEFNHFAINALQEPSLHIACAYMIESNSISSLQSLEREINNILIKGGTREERKSKVMLAGMAYALHRNHEDATRILDKLIFESIGIDLDLPWRGKERQYAAKNLPDPQVILSVPVGGDAYKGLNDREVIHRVLNWQEHLNPIMKTPYTDNFYDSLKNLNIEIMSLSKIKELEEKDKLEEKAQKERFLMEKKKREKNTRRKRKRK